MESSHAEPRRRLRLPWALLGAIALVAGFEVGVRRLSWPQGVPYELGLAEYHAVADTLDLTDPAEVAFIGSSRTRESIHLPTLRDALSKAMGQPVTVANYAVSGAKAHEFNAMARRLLREPRPPRVIICGVSERDFGTDSSDSFDRAATFWTFAEWQRARADGLLPVFEILPIVIRNHLGEYWRTLQLRESLRSRMAFAIVPRTVDEASSPIRGEETNFQISRRYRSMVKRPVSEPQVLRYVNSLQLDEGFPNPTLLRSFRLMMDACREAGVPLILYEPPTPKILRDHLPPGLYKQFVALLESEARAGGANFVAVGKLPLRLSNMHYLEQSHMSERGARAFTPVFADVIAKQLQRDEKERKREKQLKQTKKKKRK